MLKVFQKLLPSSWTSLSSPPQPPSLQAQPDIAPLKPNQDQYKTVSASHKFDQIQSQEQLLAYGFGGLTEGLGKFLQRDGRERYLEHPLAKWIFTPFYNSATYLIQSLNDSETSSEEIEEQLTSIIGGGGIFIGNSFKWLSNIISMVRYRRLAKESNDARAIKKASEGNSVRNMVYLTEKVTYSLAGALYATGQVELSIGSMIVSQAAALSLAGISLKANSNIISSFWKNPHNLKMARDASKVTGINLAKGLWALSTLGVLTYVTVLPTSIHDQINLGIGNKIPSQNLDDFYNILVQNSWELPWYMIGAGAIFMVAPSLLTFALNTKHAWKASPVNGETAEMDLENQDLNIIRKRRIYYMIGATSDVCNGIGGYYTASLFWQPLGAVFNAAGSLGSYLQTQYGVRYGLTDGKEGKI